MIRRPSAGFSSRCWTIPSVTTSCTMPLMSALPSFAFVWPSNWGSVSFTLITAVSPSRTSSPERLASFSASVPDLRAHVLSEPVSALRKPATCVPPSTVWMLFAKARTFSAKPSLYCSATSTLVPSTTFSTKIGRGFSVSRRRLRWRTKLVDPALEVEVLLAVDPLVDEPDPDALVEVGRFAQPGADRLPREVERLEDLRVGLEERPRAAAAVPGRDEAPVRLRPAALLGDRRGRGAARVLLEPSLSVPQDFDPHRLGERIYDAHTDAVEAAGDLVAAAAELPAGVEDGHDDLQGALSGGVLVDRDAAAVVDHLQLPSAWTVT